MRFGGLLLGCLLVLCNPLAAGQPQLDSSTLNLQQYSQRLAQFRQQIEAAEHLTKSEARELSGALPVSLRVNAGGRDYDISLYFVHEALAKAEANEKDWGDARQVTLNLLAAMQQEAGAPSSSGELTTAHARVNAILSAREFRGVHGPTWWDQVKAQITDWITSLFMRIFGRVGTWADTKYVIYGIALLILVCFAAWIWRMLPRTPLEQALLGVVGPAVSAKHWSEWLREAHAAGDAGAWRDAVHLAYWAGISLLEARGAWRPDRARTPREYIQLLSPEATERAVLQSITREFERAWYAQQSTGKPEFDRMLEQLQTLGCQA